MSHEIPCFAKIDTQPTDTNGVKTIFKCVDPCLTRAEITGTPDEVIKGVTGLKINNCRAIKFFGKE